jgi:hypothetical protein
MSGDINHCLQYRLIAYAVVSQPVNQAQTGAV